MKRRSCLKTGTVAAMAILAKRRALAARAKKPNLLFIMTDQQRWDAMSCAGNKVLETPNLDRLAREGVKFSSAYSAQPICVPARAVLLTGLSAVNVKVETNRDYTREDIPDVPTFDSVLKDHGYAAEYYGKWHTPRKFTACYDNDVRVVGNVPGATSELKAYQAYLVDKGVTRKEAGEGELFSGRHQRPYRPIELDENYDKQKLDPAKKQKLKTKQSGQYGCVDLPPNVSFTAFPAEETLNALERVKDRAFTLTCSFDPPHPPMMVQEPYYSMYPPETIETPLSIDDSMEGSPYAERAAEDRQSRYRDAEQIQKMRSIYYGMVREVDDWVGRILNKLDELGLAENTLVVFTSDHGEMLGDHGMHSKMIFYEGSVHVPFLMRFPGRIKAGTVVEQPISSMDICPTILDYLSMPPIKKSDGISLRKMVEGKKVDHVAVSYTPGTRTPNYMIRSGDLKLMMAQKAGNKSVDALYDLGADPLETRNLIVSPKTPEKNREQARMMKKRLVKWMESHEPPKAFDLEKREI